MRFQALVLAAAIMAVVTWAAPAQLEAQPLQTAEQLDQLVAPVALYPDPLLMQILMASTYPLEVVEAERWLHDHPEMSEATRRGELAQMSWDPSVTSLTVFPDVLYMMSANLNWTEKLGEAFLAQQQDVMDAVQRMRSRAYMNGKLQSTGQAIVTANQGIITIEPAVTDLVYVPYYNPALLYGDDWMPSVWYYPGVMVSPYGWVPGESIAFGVGVYFGGWMFAACDWHLHHVWVNGNYWTWPCYRGGWTQNTAYGFGVYSQNGTWYYRPRSGSSAPLTATQQFAWQHDPVHRAGVTYQNPTLQQRYPRTSWPIPSNELRGYPSNNTMPRSVPYPYSMPRTSAPNAPGRSTSPWLPMGGDGRGQYDVRAGQRGANSSGYPGGSFSHWQSAPSRPVFSAPRGGGGGHR